MGFRVVLKNHLKFPSGHNCIKIDFASFMTVCSELGIDYDKDPFNRYDKKFWDLYLRHDWDDEHVWDNINWLIDNLDEDTIESIC